MKIEEFGALVRGLSGMSHVERIKHFAWFLQTQDKRERVAAADIRRCYDQLHCAPPANVATQMHQMADKRPPELLKDAKGYRLENRVKEQLDAKYGRPTETVVVDMMLQALPGKISDEAERMFLSEAITCFRHKAFRATIVMTWNLAYDHLLNWILAKHLAAFNAAIAVKYKKRVSVVMTKKEDFSDEFKEYEVIEVCSTAALIDGNTKKILYEKLSRRNMAAHPSMVEITVFHAQETIADLVNNVILKLT